MKLARYAVISVVCSFAILLSGCTQVQYVAHLVKNLPGSHGGYSGSSTGEFKVGSPYRVGWKTYRPRETYHFTQTGIASWYGPDFHGKRTANGEIYDKRALTAAHKTLQLPCIIRVTNLGNGKSVVLRVNDRGPYARGRILDVSERAAELLGFKKAGTARVKLEVLEKESREVARLAKAGKSTKNTELSYNRRHQPVSSSPEPVSSSRTSPDIYGADEAGYQPVKSAGYASGEAMPGKTYVQVGSFSTEQNAMALSKRLSYMGQQPKVYMARINGRTFYRVRFGPYDSVDQADSMLNQLLSDGNSNAIMVSDRF